MLAHHEHLAKDAQPMAPSFNARNSAGHWTSEDFVAAYRASYDGTASCTEQDGACTTKRALTPTEVAVNIVQGMVST